MIKAPDRRAAVLRALESSGLTMVEFCRRRGLPYATVAAWRSMERRRGSGFVEVEAPVPVSAAGNSPVSSAALCAELLLPGGAVLRVYHRAGAGEGGAL